MIRFISLAAVALAFLAVSAIGAEPTIAGGYHNKHHRGYHGGHGGHHYRAAPFVYNLGRVVGAFAPHRRHYYRGDHYYRSDRYYAAPYAYRHRPAPRHYQYSHHGNGCHAVSKSEYHHGRLARIGGTMCYDGYGYPYVVSGSRYVMHYYD